MQFLWKVECAVKYIIYAFVKTSVQVSASIPRGMELYSKFEVGRQNTTN